MKKQRTKLIIALIIVAIIVGIRFSPLSNYLSFQNLQQYKEALKQTVSNYYLASIFLYIITYILITTFSIPVAAVLTLAAGFLFGTLPATIYVNIGATTGAICAFLASRYLVGEWFQKKYKNKLLKFNKEIKQNGTNYLLTLRLLFVMPFFLINILAGLTNVRLFTFFWTTSLGIIPGTLVYAFAGKQLDYINKPSDIFSIKVLLAFLFLAVLSLVPVIFKKIKTKKW